MDFLLFFIVSICIFLGWYYTKYRETLAIVSKLPGPRRWPIVGNAFVFMGKSPSELLVKLTAIVEKYPKFACLMIGPQAEILIMDPKLAEQILSSQKLIDKAGEYDFLLDWIGTGLLTSTGKKWFSRRKVITPAFHFKILDQFVEVFDKHSNIFIQNLKKSNGKPVDVFELISLCALDNICGEICIP
jgi:cytochrome P450 family 4